MNRDYPSNKKIRQDILEILDNMKDNIKDNDYLEIVNLLKIIKLEDNTRDIQKISLNFNYIEYDNDNDCIFCRSKLLEYYVYITKRTFSKIKHNKNKNFINICHKIKDNADRIYLFNIYKSIIELCEDFHIKYGINPTIIIN